VIVIVVLRAAQWNPKAAIQRLEDTLKWRREMNMYNVAPETVEPEVHILVSFVVTISTDIVYRLSLAKKLSLATMYVCFSGDILISIMYELQLECRSKGVLRYT
jgi:hypothetical protein